jgi:LacI family transcriptional regulator
VPDEVSVVGVGDDDRFCRTSRPELSSVRLPTGEVGRQAAELLLSLLDAGAAPPSPILLPPADVVARESSGESAVSQPDVAAALSFISKHIRRRLTVQHVVDHLAISRRALERQFIDVLGRTPLEEIRRVRIRRAKQLLMETDLTLPEIARECGFIRHQRLANAFKAATGMTPSVFRARTLSAIIRRGR